MISVLKQQGHASHINDAAPACKKPSVRNFRESDKDKVVELYLSAHRGPPWHLDLTKADVESRVRYYLNHSDRDMHFAVAIAGHPAERIMGLSIAYSPNFSEIQYLRRLVHEDKPLRRIMKNIMRNPNTI